ncbi:MAG: response regulator [Pirellulaceae bacterium]
MNALVVDDSKAMRRILTKIMKDTGYTTFEAADGIEALEALKTLDPCNLVLVDWNMPNMDGYEFIKTVRADDQYNAVRIVMVTTETEPAKMARAMMAGADEFVMKPFTKDILVDKLKLNGVTVVTDDIPSGGTV